MMFPPLFFVPPAEEENGRPPFQKRRTKPYVFHVVPDADERAFLEEQLDRTCTTIARMFGFVTGLHVFAYDSEEELLRSPALRRIGDPDVLIVKSRRLMRGVLQPAGFCFERSAVSHVAALKLVAAATNVLIAQRRIRVDPRRMDTYGHPLVPDWLETAIPILCDDPDESRQWAGSIRPEDPSRVIPLRDLLTMRHPLSGEIAEYLIEQQVPNPAVPQALSISEGLSSHVMQYSFQVYMLSRYLLDHEGPAFFGKAVALALEGASPDELFALADRVPRSIEGIEAAYLEYGERGE